MRRLVLPSLIAFAVLVAVVQLSESSPAFRGWLADTVARAARLPAPAANAPVADARPTARAPATPAVAAPAAEAPTAVAEAPANVAPAAPGAAPSNAPAAPLAAGTAGAAGAAAAEGQPADPAPAPEPSAAAAAAPAKDLTPPSPPTGVAVEATGDRAVRVRWAIASDESGVSAYEVSRDGSVIAEAAALEATEDGLAPLTTVCYTVAARDRAGNRSVPSASACVKLPDLTQPVPPTVLQARATSESSVALSWSGASDAGGVAAYELLRQGTPVGTADSPRAVETNLLAGRTYCWTVRARDVAGNVSKDSPEACATLPDLTPPSPPPALVAAPNAPDRLVFAWHPAEDNVGVDRYEVLRDGQLVTHTDAATPLGLEGGLSPATEYCFSVIAVDGAGNRSAPSTPACARTADPGVPAGPWALSVTPRSATVLTLRWKPSPEPGVVYSVYWGGKKRIGATPRTEYTVAGLKAGEKRCFHVTAVDPAGKESPDGLEACTSAARSTTADASGL